MSAAKRLEMILLYAPGITQQHSFDAAAFHYTRVVAPPKAMLYRRPPHDAASAEMIVERCAIARPASGGDTN